MPTVGVLNVAIKGTTKGLEKSIGRVKGLFKGLGGAVARIGGLLGGISAAGALAGFERMTASIDQLAKEASALGVTTEQLSALRFAADRSGISAQSLGASIQRFSRRLAEATMGSGEARKALNTLGLDANRLIQLPVQERMAEISRAMGDVKNASDRIALAFQLFGREGVNMTNLLGSGEDAFRGLLAEAQQFGAVISTETAAKAERFQDALTNVKAVLKGVFITVTDLVSPTMIALAEQFAAWGATASKSGAGISRVFRPVKRVLDAIANVVLGIVGAFNLLQAGIAKVVEVAAKLAAKLPGLSDSTRQFFRILAEEEGRAAGKLFEEGIDKIKTSLKGQGEFADILPQSFQDFLVAVDQVQVDARNAAEQIRTMRREGQTAAGQLERMATAATSRPEARQPAIQALERGSVEAVAKISEIFSSERRRDIEHKQLRAQEKTAMEVAKLRQEVKASGGWLAVEDIL